MSVSRNTNTLTEEELDQLFKTVIDNLYYYLYNVVYLIVIGFKENIK